MLTFPETGDDEEYATPSRVAGQWVELRNWSSGQWFGESVFWTNLFNDLFQVKKVYFIQVYRPVKQLVKQDLLERTALQIATQFWD